MEKTLPHDTFPIMPTFHKNTIMFLQVKTLYLHFRFHSNYFVLPRFLKKLADDQCSSITKGSICHIKHNVDTTIFHVSGLTRNCMFNGSIYCV